MQCGKLVKSRVHTVMSMVEISARQPPTPRITWTTVVTGCICAMAVLASCPTGSAFLHTTTTTSFNMLRERNDRRYSSASTDAIQSMPEDNNHPMNEEDIDTDDENDEEEDVHPSVAWLYPSAVSSGSNSKKPTRRTLAVDYGTCRVGLAIGVGISPRVVPGITNHGSDLEVVRQVLVRARGEGIRDIVVGLPLIRNGTECEMCRTVRSFACVLADAGAASSSPASVFLWDERFSSAQAEAMLDANGGGIGNKVEIDSLAASLILEHYFAEGGADKAERIAPASVASPEIVYAAGRTGQGGEADDDFGEASRRKLYKERADSIRSMAQGEEYVPVMRAPKKKRKRRR